MGVVASSARARRHATALAGMFAYGIMGLPLGTAAAPVVEVAPITVTPWASTALNRSVHGFQTDSNVALRGLQVGRAAAFFGVDRRSSASSQFLTSGLRWRYRHDDLRQLTFSASHTQGRGTDIGAETLMRVIGQFDAGRSWYAPTLSAEIDQVRDRHIGSDLATAGRALRFGVASRIAGFGYGARLYRTAPGFDALGSVRTPGERGVAISTRYRWSDRLRVSERVKYRRGLAPGRVAKLGESLTVHTFLSTFGADFKLHAQHNMDPAPIDDGARSFGAGATLGGLKLAGWRIRPRFGWYENRWVAPTGLAVSGPLGGINFGRTVYLDNLPIALAPSFTIARSAFEQHGLMSQSSLSLNLQQNANHFGLSLGYISAGWSGLAEQSNVRLMLSYSRSAGQLFAGL